MKECHCSVKIRNLRVKRGSNIILDNVSLTANHGETLALIGRNGAGKTTLLKAILRVGEFCGRIDFFDSKGNKISNPKIGYVPQRLSFDRSTPLTVMDLFCANSSRLAVWLGHTKKTRNKAIEVLEKVGMNKHVDSPLGRLSGGELQRVLLAFALEPRPDILLYSIINSMREDYHMPVLLVSHDLGHVVKYSTSYALIDHTVVETGKACELVNSRKVRETFGIDVDGAEEVWR